MEWYGHAAKLIRGFIGVRKNGYRRFLRAESLYSRVREPATLSVTVLISRTLNLGLNVTLTSVFHNIVILLCDPCIFSTKV
jgi:hypothetical protein